MSQSKHAFRRATGRYVIGLVSALIVTLLAYFIVTQQWLTSGIVTAVVILLLAAAQLLLQLFFFLHLDEEHKPRWQTYSFMFTAAMLLIVVVGSLWIMMHLNYRMDMSGSQMDQYMKEQTHQGF